MPCIVVPAPSGFAALGMVKNGVQAWPAAGPASWTPITTWTPNAGSSVDGSHRLVITGGGPGRTISAAAPFSGGTFNRTHQIRLIDQSGNVLASSPVESLNAGTCTIAPTTVDLTTVTAILMQGAGTDSWCGDLQPTGCYLTVT